jgi:hypothetical protein
MQAERLPGQELDETSGTTATRSTGEPGNRGTGTICSCGPSTVPPFGSCAPPILIAPPGGAYDAETYLGTVHAQHDAVNGTWPVWHVQTLDERHPAIEDAVRAIRRPPSWTREREQARRWAVDLPYRRADPPPASAARGGSVRSSVLLSSAVVVWSARRPVRDGVAQPKGRRRGSGGVTGRSMGGACRRPGASTRPGLVRVARCLPARLRRAGLRGRGPRRAGAGRP